MLVAVLSTEILAPTTTAPVLSVTVPLTAPVVLCARPATEHKMMTASVTKKVILLMSLPRIPTNDFVCSADLFICSLFLKWSSMAASFAS